MRTNLIMCKDCRCFFKANTKKGALADPDAGVCVRYPPTSNTLESWAHYPVVSKEINGCFDGIARSKEQLVADTLMGGGE
jgi:hypothetical protein